MSIPQLARIIPSYSCIYLFTRMLQKEKSLTITEPKLHFYSLDKDIMVVTQLARAFETRQLKIPYTSACSS